MAINTELIVDMPIPVRHALLLALSLIADSGCSQLLTNPASSAQGVVLAKPLQVSYQSELVLARAGQLLDEAALSDAQRAQLFYERGVVFDSVGLRYLARFDFSRALQIKPDFAEAYNFIGVYLTLDREFNEAYEAFDAVIELAPDFDYAYLNRGIAFYYAGRYDLAQADLQTFYERDPQDPFRQLWLYLVEQRIDARMASEHLERHYQQATDNSAWGWQIVEVMLGKRSERQLISSIPDEVENNRQQAERLCEAYFYLAKRQQALRQPDRANNLFKLALAGNVYDYIEHRYALMELSLQDSALSE